MDDIVTLMKSRWPGNICQAYTELPMPMSANYHFALEEYSFLSDIDPQFHAQNIYTIIKCLKRQLIKIIII